MGIAIAAGTDVAIASAGAILGSGDPRSVLSAFTVVVALNAQLLRRLDLRPEQSVRRILGR
ncbi:cation transport ATPase [Mycobacteroides chelonae]|nr:cation transport ATPase [Mycobacteroides chelonae]